MEYTSLIHGVTELLGEASRQRFLEARLDIARVLSSQGRNAEAVAAYQGILKTFKSYPAAWHELALIQLALDDAEAAKTSLIESLRLDPWRTQAHYDFGRIHATHAGSSGAVTAYLATITAPGDRGASLASAEAACRTALRLDPTSENHLRLAHLQIANLRVSEAVETLNAAVTAGFDNAEVSHSLAAGYALLGRDRESQIRSGHAHYFKLEYAEAVDRYSRILEAGPAGPLVYARLGTAYAALHRFSKAIDICRQGISIHQDDETLACLSAQFLQEDGQLEASRREAAAASVRFPTNIRLKQYALLSLPVVYETTDDLARQRDAYEDGLDTLTRHILEDRSPISLDPAHGLGSNFFLAYQGGDDKPLQIRFGALLHEIARARHPQWSRPVPMPTLGPAEKLRVGYVSTHLYRHTVAKLFLGWLQERDRELTEVYVYHLGNRIDPMTQQYERAADHFRQMQGAQWTIGQQIIDDQLHILVYLDIGMDDITTQLAALYLAPVQCVAWGHPVTTGLPTLDYFISSELMEPQDAEQQYSETLVRLPGAGVNVPPPYLEHPRRTRVDFGLTDEDRVYLSPQSLFKYLPQHDEVFCRIAARVPKAKFVFLRAGSDNITNILKHRLLDAFARHGLDGNQFLIFLPPQSYRDYLDLNLAADVFLDQPGWSGGMTALEALGCGLPVVTWPGAFMRGRHSLAFLQQMDLGETIALDLDGFVEIAARLGTDRNWRQELKDAIAARKHRLFDDTLCVRALERFYVRCTTAMK